MKASLPICLTTLLCLVLSGSAWGEYPFDPLYESGGGPVNAPPYNDGGYGPNPFQYEDPYPPVDSLFAADSPILPGWISATFNPGTERVIYNGEIFQPLYQSGQTIWYVDFRGQGDDYSAGEFNLGTGVRTLSDMGWVFGFYTFWDHLRTSHGNHFNQGMIGIEAMSVLWDARFNVYFPESKAKATGSTTAGVSNGTVVMQSGLERAYWGLDMEVGNLLWATGPGAQHEIRGFLALYHFDHSANTLHSITGPRARVEWRWFDLPYFGPGSRFTFGVTAEYDRVRNGQLFAFARLRIPLDVWAHQRRRLSPLHRRMLDPIVRDVDIVSNTSRHTEAAINPETGREFGRVHQINGDTDYVGDLLEQSQEDDVFLFKGGAGDIILPRSFELKPGQSALGGGSALMIRGARTGKQAMWNLNGTRPTVEFNGNTLNEWHKPPPGQDAGLLGIDHSAQSGFQMADRTSLRGVDLIGGGSSVLIHDAAHVDVSDVQLSNFEVTGVDIENSRDVDIKNIRIKDSAAKVQINSASSMSSGVASSKTASLDFEVTGQSDQAAPFIKTAYVIPGFQQSSLDPDQQPAGAGIFIQESSQVNIEDVEIHDVATQGILVRQSDHIAVKRAKIDKTNHDGVRLVETSNVDLSQIELEAVATYAVPEFNSKGFQELLPRETAGISLENAENTSISELQMQSDSQYGIFSRDSENTSIQDVSLAQIDEGITISGGRNAFITRANILLPSDEGDEDRRFYASSYQVGVSPYYEPEPEFVTFGMFILPQRRQGMTLDNVGGNVDIRESDVRGGLNGHGIVVANSSFGDPSTDVMIADNHIDVGGYSSGLIVSSSGDHDLNAQIVHNEIHSEAVGFHVRHDADGRTDVLFDHNKIDSWMGATSQRSGTLNLVVTENQIANESSTNNRFQTRNGGDLKVLYSGNTSTDSAVGTEFFNKEGTLKVEPFAANDHMPQIEGAVDTLPDGTLRDLAPGLFQ